MRLYTQQKILDATLYALVVNWSRPKVSVLSAEDNLIRARLRTMRLSRFFPITFATILQFVLRMAVNLRLTSFVRMNRLT